MEVQITPRMKVASPCWVPEEWVESPGPQRPQTSKRQVAQGKGKPKMEKIYLHVHPGAILDSGKIPPERLARMTEKDTPALIPVKMEIPADSPKTAIHASAAEMSPEDVARVDTGKRRRRTKKKPAAASKEK